MKFIILIILLMAENLRAEVWHSRFSWKPETETQYSEWIKNKVAYDLFSNPSSSYYGIKTDCADAAIFLRVIFAYENQLSVYFKDNNGDVISNSTNKYDVYSENSERLKAFLHDLGESMGSEVLASDNTYPIALSAIRPGDMYITKWTDDSGIDTRHVYIVKAILPTGDLLLISSTQPRAIRPLLPRKGMPSHFISGEPYGFKRFLSGVKFEHPDQSFSQYEDLKKGERNYFAKIKETHQTVKDTFENNIAQRFENICMALKARADVIKLAQEKILINMNACFSHDEYDEYSTPSRDHNISMDIQTLVFGWKTIKLKNLDKDLSEELHSAMEYLSGNDDSLAAKNHLRAQCLIDLSLNFNRQLDIDIKDFYERFKDGIISSNPNEPISARWGISRETGKCPKR